VTAVGRGLLTGLLIFVLQAPAVAEAGALGKAVARGATRSLVRRVPVYRRPLGPVHQFRTSTPLQRYTNRPHTDVRKGLPAHSFWVRPHPGRPASAPHIQQKLNIPHPVRAREVTGVKPGTVYHERPIKGGSGHTREVILEKPVPGRAIQVQGAIPP